MANYIYQHQYTSPTDFNVIQVRADGNRKVSKDKPDYLDFLSEGNTPEVIEWVAPIEPTLEELKASKIRMLKMNAQMFIEKEYPQFKQRSAALGVYDEAYKTTMVAFIKAKKADVDALEVHILASTSKEELDGIIIEPLM